MKWRKKYGIEPDADGNPVVVTSGPGARHSSELSALMDAMDASEAELRASIARSQRLTAWARSLSAMAREATR